MFEIRYILIKVINARMYIDKNKNYCISIFLWYHIIIGNISTYQRSECSLSNYFVFIILLNTKWSESHSIVSDSLSPHELYSPWNSPGQNTGVGSLSLLQGIFPTHGSNPGLLHFGRVLYQLRYKGSPRIPGSLSFLQWIFLTQQPNWVFLHCTWIFTNLSILPTDREAILQFKRTKKKKKKVATQNKIT